MKIFKFCKKYLLKHKVMLLIYIMIGILINIISLVIPYISGQFIDNLVEEKNIQFLIKYSVMFAVLNISSIILGYVFNMIYVQYQTTAGFELNSDILNHLKKVSISYFSKSDTVYLNQRINNDSNGLIIFSMNIILDVFINILIIIFTSLILIKLNIKITIVLIILLCVYFLVYLLFKNTIFTKSFELKEAQDKFFSKLNEQLFKVKFIKIHAVNNLFCLRLNKSFMHLLSKALGYQKISYIFSGLDNTIMVFAKITLYVIGGLEIIKGNLTIGFFTIILSYFSKLLNSMKYFFNLGKIYQDNFVSYKRLQDLLKLNKETNGEKLIDSIKSIQIDKLSFSYNNKVIFQDYSKQFLKGKVYCIIGDNGVGKTTLVNLLLGLYIDEFEGNIKYNDTDIKDINMYNMRHELIGVLEQEPILLNDTILYNLSLDSNCIEHNKLKEFIEILNFNKYFNTLTKGFETVINEKSNNISGGEKQKIALIRVLLKDMDLMILDEPTSALDIHSKEKFINYINSIKKDKIIIFITHDKSLVKMSDEVIQL